MAFGTERVIGWAAISERFYRDHKSTSRLKRVFRAPARAIAVAAMRRLGLKRSIACKLPWGDTFFGVLPEAVSSVIWRTGHYESLTSFLIVESLRKGDIFVDVGAHFGYFTLLASRLVGQEGKVVAIEAMASTFAALENNLARNGIENVETYNLAAYSENTKLRFRDYGLEHSTLNTAFTVRGVLEGREADWKETDVEARAADDLLADTGGRTISLIKIDAESSEEYVLTGLKRTLSKHRPILLIELGGASADKAREAKITGMLSELGYVGRQWRDDRLTPMPSETMLPYDNYVFLHAAGRTISPGGRPGRRISSNSDGDS